MAKKISKAGDGITVNGYGALVKKYGKDWPSKATREEIAQASRDESKLIDSSGESTAIDSNSKTKKPIVKKDVPKPVALNSRVSAQNDLIKSKKRESQNYAIVDKAADSIFYFNPYGQNITGEPVITGASRNDIDYGQSMKDWFKATGSNNHEEYFNYLKNNQFQTTPSGIFKINSLRTNTADNPDMLGNLINIFNPTRAKQIRDIRLKDYGNQQKMFTLVSELGVPQSKAIHGTGRENRVAALNTPNSDRALSNGCINVNGKTVCFDTLDKGSSLFVLPEQSDNILDYSTSTVSKLNNKQFANTKKQIANALASRGIKPDTDAINFISTIAEKESQNMRSSAAKLEKAIPWFSKTVGAFQINPNTFKNYLPEDYDGSYEQGAEAVYNFYQANKDKSPTKAYNKYSGDRKGEYDKNFDWLYKSIKDSYKDGGNVSGWLDNYNDYSVSAPEGYKGDGFDMTGRNYSPAWGGQFEMGGDLPKAQGGKTIPPASVSDATRVVMPEIVQKFSRKDMSPEEKQQLASTAKEKKQRIDTRKSAVAAIDNKKPFKLPTGESKTYDKMSGREKRYVEGLALEQRGRINEDEESFLDDLNPLNIIGTMAGGLGKAPYEAKMSNSNLPYLAAIGTPLAAGAFAQIGAENTGQFLNNVFNPLAGIVPNKPLKEVSNVIQESKNSVLASTSNPSKTFALSDKGMERLVTADKTITDFGKKVIDELHSAEAVKRLKNQFKLANPKLNDDQLNYLVSNRLHEVNLAVEYNKPKYLTNYINHKNNTLTEEEVKRVKEHFPDNNAHWSSYSLYDIAPRSAPQSLSFEKLPRFNLQKSERSPYLQFLNSEFSPGAVTLGKNLEKNTHVVDHEIGHAIQKGGQMPIDDQLIDLIKSKNYFDRIFHESLDAQSKADKSYFFHADGDTYTSEPYAFLREQRSKMLERGIINDKYEEITPLKLLKARLAARKNVNRNFMEGDRLVKFTPFWKYPELAKIMNTAPAAIPAVIGAAAMQNSSDVPEQEMGGSIPGATGMMYARHGAPSNGPYAKKTMPSAQEGTSIDPIAQEIKSYVESPLYLQRLKGMGVNFPESLQEERSLILKNVKFGKASSPNTDVQESNRFPLINLSPDTTEYAKAHELGHTISGYGSIVNVESMNEAYGNQMSPRESWYFMNRNLNDAKTPSDLNQHTDSKTVIKNYAWGQQHDDKNKLHKYFSPFPTSTLEGKRINELYHGKLDPHDTNPQENYGDLTTLRHALLKQGYTKSFGENLSQEVLDKAFKDRKINSIMEVQRMRKNFKDSSILDINNKIAYQDNNQGGDVIAKDGTSVYYQYGLDFTPKSMQNGGTENWASREMKQMYNTKMRFDDKSVLDVVREAAKLEGIDPSLLMSSAWQEGMNTFLTENKKNWTVGEHYNLPDDKSAQFPVDGFQYYGLDTFSDRYDKLKKYLPKNFEFAPFKAVNEKGETINTAAFKNNRDALVAKAAMLKNEIDSVKEYAQKKNLNLDQKALDYFTLSSYNGGFGNAKIMMDQYEQAKDKNAFIDNGETTRKGVHKNVLPRILNMKVVNDLISTEDSNKKLLENQLDSNKFIKAPNSTNPLPLFKDGGQTNDDREMLEGVADMLRRVKDPKNRKDIANYMMGNFRDEDVTFEPKDFLQDANVFKNGGEMIRRADGSYSRRGLWDNIRANKGSGKKPTKEMLKQEKKIRASKEDGGPIPVDPLGYWNPDNVGNPVIIPSTDITMRGVDQDLIGISNTGDVKKMKKGKNYKFDGDYVTEYPTMEYGGELTKLDQLTNFTNYNTKQPGGWLDKYK